MPSALTLGTERQRGTIHVHEYRVGRACGSDWRLAGTTYNSAAFVDLASVAGAGPAKSFTAMRVSGQPAKDGWRTVVQKLTVNCDTRMFVDAGSRIEQADGSV